MMLLTGPARATSASARVEGHGLRSGEDRHARKSHHEREHERPEWVEMREGVQGEAARLLGRGIAAAQGHPAMGEFVDGCGDRDERDADGHHDVAAVRACQKA